MKDARFRKIYGLLRGAYGPQRWWPVTPPGETVPRYTGGPRNDRQRFEVAVGAVLTQSTAWTNAARAVESLNRLDAMSPAALHLMDEAELAAAIRPAGYFNQKARRLKRLAAHLLAEGIPSRESLLALDGIGPETADSIMLYAFDEPLFVVDAYTRRIFGRLGLVAEEGKYDDIRLSFERNLSRRAAVYREYHALVVEHGKRVCKKIPVCEKCLLHAHCAMYLKKSKRTAIVRNG